MLTREVIKSSRVSVGDIASTATATEGFPHDMPSALPPDVYSIWQNRFMLTGHRIGFLSQIQVARSLPLLKEFLPTHNLCITWVLDLDPRRHVLAVVSAVPQFCNNALQVFSAGKVK